jgi:hypothetical protein
MKGPNGSVKSRSSLRQVLTRLRRSLEDVRRHGGRGTRGMMHEVVFICIFYFCMEFGVCFGEL